MIMVKSLSENEKATKSALEAFISSITISQDWTDDIYELPVCARMPLLMLYQTCNINSENKKKVLFFNIIFFITKCFFYFFLYFI